MYLPYIVNPILLILNSKTQSIKHPGQFLDIEHNDSLVNVLTLSPAPVVPPHEGIPPTS